MNPGNVNSQCGITVVKQSNQHLVLTQNLCAFEKNTIMLGFYSNFDATRAEAA